MKKAFKKLTAAVMAVTTLAVGTVGMTASASTGNGMESAARSTKSYWSVHRISGAPSSTDKFYDSGTVRGLTNGSDTGVTFVKTAFSDSGNGNIMAQCDIQHNVKADINEYAYISAYRDESTCLFKSGWYSICGGNVTYTISVVNYAGYGFNIEGYAW